MRPWMAEGHLPTLARLSSEGRSRPIANFPGYGNGTYWPSFYTGTLPAEHGRFYIDQLVPGTYRVAPFDMGRDFQAQPFWTAVDRKGGRVAVIDAVRTGISPVREGIEVCNRFAHDADGPTVTHPAALTDELHARFGEDPLAIGSDRFLRRNPDMASFVRILRDRASWKATWCREPLQSTHWDLFYVTFGEARDIGHLGWDIHDETHTEHDPAQRASLGDPLLAIYRHLDSCVEDLVSATGPDVSVVIVTGPGMERNAFGNHVLALILQRLQQATALPDLFAIWNRECDFRRECRATRRNLRCRRLHAHQIRKIARK